MNSFIKWTIAGLASVAFAANAATAEAQGPAGRGGRMLPPPVVRPVPPRPAYYLGVTGRDVRDGFMITHVSRFSPAAQVGLEPGDVIHKANGVEIHCEHDLQDAIQRSNGRLNLIVHNVRTNHDQRVRVQLAGVGHSHDDHDHGHGHGFPGYGGRPGSMGQPAGYGRPGAGPFAPSAREL